MRRHVKLRFMDYTFTDAKEQGRKLGHSDAGPLAM